MGTTGSGGEGGGQEGVKERYKEMHKHAERSGRMYSLKMMLHAEHMLSMQLANTAIQIALCGVLCVACRGVIPLEVALG